jgi:hypothetical protein
MINKQKNFFLKIINNLRNLTFGFCSKFFKSKKKFEFSSQKHNFHKKHEF